METVQRLRERFPTLQDPPSDDICYATQNRQVAVKAMAPECELVIVVGSRWTTSRCETRTRSFGCPRRR
ncbi:Probable 4-hydroxy-3-methylbut-2-enyl diphosphate reductase [Mycobacteroides abscessus subsp. abscessus]|nr:Probable 4-hydroxy-3-methylbut-2-enyl diphosphate reductase [Mycobacteroides abscessus subsp. abscessus]